MTVEDARDILGVKAGATLDEVRAAYLKELNAAKSLLTGQ